MTPAEIVTASFIALAAMTMDRGPVCTFNDPRGHALLWALILPSCQPTNMGYGEGFQWMDFAMTRANICIPRRTA